MKHVLVIGNGFDLDHHRKTSYSDYLSFLNELVSGKYDNNKAIIDAVESIFKGINDDYRNSSLLNYCLKQYSFNSNNDKWIDLERDLKEYIDTTIDFVTYFNTNDDEEIIRKRKTLIKSGIRASSLDTKYALLMNFSKSIFEQKEARITIKSHYVTAWGTVDLQAILIQIEKELTCLSHLLEYYLKEIEPDLRDKEYIPKEMFKPFNFDAVISFNYTNTVSELYHPDNTLFIYPHGKVSDANTVLGYNDYDQGSQDLMFKKYYRRLINSTDYIYMDDFKDLCEIPGVAGYVEDMPEITFFGHSLDISDEDLLRELLSSDIHHIIIYYKNELDRSEKIMNLIKILGKKEAIERINKGEICFKPIQ